MFSTHLAHHAVDPLLDLVLRLTVAVILGALIGLNREFKGKPAGLRTHALVALGASVATSLIMWHDMAPDVPRFDALSRVLQGIITGIGFLGAGVIVHGSGKRIDGTPGDGVHNVGVGNDIEEGAAGHRHDEHGYSNGRTVHGLTTAASIWLAACLGAACGAGAWLITFISFLLIMLILLAGGPLERSALRRFKARDDD